MKPYGSNWALCIGRVKEYAHGFQNLCLFIFLGGGQGEADGWVSHFSGIYPHIKCWGHNFYSISPNVEMQSFQREIFKTGVIFDSGSSFKLPTWAGGGLPRGSWGPPPAADGPLLPVLPGRPVGVWSGDEPGAVPGVEGGPPYKYCDSGDPVDDLAWKKKIIECNEKGKDKSFHM